MCLQSQSSRLPPCETLLSWIWWSADQKWNGIPVQTSLHGDSSLPPARVLQAHNGLRWAQGEGKSVTGKNILHFPLEQSRGGRSMVGVKPIRNLSLIRNSDPLTRSSNLQAPSAHARERGRDAENVLFSTPPERPHDSWGIKIISWSVSGMIDKCPGAGSSPGVPSSSPALWKLCQEPALDAAGSVGVGWAGGNLGSPSSLHTGPCCIFRGCILGCCP